MMTNEIVVFTNDGAYRMTTEAFDLLIERHMPSSANKLRAKIEALSADEGGDIDYSGLRTITACLAVLAQYEGLIH